MNIFERNIVVVPRLSVRGCALFLVLCFLVGAFSAVKEDVSGNGQTGTKVLSLVGADCEDDALESRCMLRSPRTLAEVTELLAFSKKDNQPTEYSLSAKRSASSDYVQYIERFESDGSCIQSLMLGAGDNGFVLRWRIQDNARCESTGFSFPSTGPSREIYHDDDGDGIFEWRAIRENGTYRPEIIVCRTWHTVDGWCNAEHTEALVTIDGLCRKFEYTSGEWMSNDKSEQDSATEGCPG